MIRPLILLGLILTACGLEDPAAPPACPSAKRAAGEDLPSGHYRTFEGGSPQCPFDTFDLQLAGDSARGYARRRGEPFGRWSFPSAGWAAYSYDRPVAGGWGRFTMTGPIRDGDPVLYFEVQIQVLDSTEYRLMYDAPCVFALRKSIVLPDSTEVWPNPPSTGIRPPQVKPKACQE